MKTIIFFFSALLCFQLNAQKKNYNGYYISNIGDTVRGNFPSYAQWTRNPSKVQFVLLNQALSISLTPENCLKFFVENYDEYIAYSGSRLANVIDDDLVMDNQMFWGAEDEDSTVTTFLRVVEKSSLCEILVLRDGLRTNFFYRLSGQTIQEFRFKKKFISDTRTVVDMDEYKDQIKKIFGGEIVKKNLIRELDNLAYREDAFEKFFQKLFSVPTENQTQKTKPGSFIINAGICLNSFSVNWDLYGRPKSFTNSVSPFVTIGYIMSFNRNFGRGFIYPHFKMYSFKNSGTATTDYSVRTSTFKTDLVLLPELNAGVNIINQETLQFFVYAGIGIMMQINGKEIYEVKPSAGSPYTYDGELSKLTGSYNVSAGLRFKKKFSVFSTYVFPTSVSNYQDYTPEHTSIQIGLGYKFR